jgi:hypothetical protein
MPPNGRDRRLTSEGVRLALRGYGDPILAELDPPVKRVQRRTRIRRAGGTRLRAQTTRNRIEGGTR